VTLATIQPISRARAAGPSPSPINIASIVLTIASGVVVSRGSPGAASLSIGSIRSSRVVRSPRRRANAFTAFVPPSKSISRLAAGLSLTVTIASHSASTLSVLPTAGCVIRACGTISFGRIGRCRSRLILSRSAPCNMAAASSSLNVLHIANRSPPRHDQRNPSSRSCTATPIRPPLARSMAATAAVITDSPRSGRRIAGNASNDALPIPINALRRPIMPCPFRRRDAAGQRSPQSIFARLWHEKI
jgi:hypothetical protein